MNSKCSLTSHGRCYRQVCLARRCCVIRSSTPPLHPSGILSCSMVKSSSTASSSNFCSSGTSIINWIMGNSISCTILKHNMLCAAISAITKHFERKFSTRLFRLQTVLRSMRGWSVGISQLTTILRVILAISFSSARPTQHHHHHKHHSVSMRSLQKLAMKRMRLRMLSRMSCFRHCSRLPLRVWTRLVLKCMFRCLIKNQHLIVSSPSTDRKKNNSNVCHIFTRYYSVHAHSITLTPLTLVSHILLKEYFVSASLSSLFKYILDINRATEAKLDINQGSSLALTIFSSWKFPIYS